MKSFAELKRRFKPGLVLRCIENTYRPEVNGQLRKIVKVQTNALAFHHLGEEEKGLFWLYFPPAADVKIIGKNTFAIALGKAGVGHKLILEFVA
jgi:hypothetical protein